MLHSEQTIVYVVQRIDDFSRKKIAGVYLTLVGAVEAARQLMLVDDELKADFAVLECVFEASEPAICEIEVGRWERPLKRVDESLKYYYGPPEWKYKQRDTPTPCQHDPHASNPTVKTYNVLGFPEMSCFYCKKSWRIIYAPVVKADGADAYSTAGNDDMGNAGSIPARCAPQCQHDVNAPNTTMRVMNVLPHLVAQYGEKVTACAVCTWGLLNAQKDEKA